jgi:hypothetical protein
MPTQENGVVSMLRAQYKQAHDVLEGTMQGVTSELAHWNPGGTANPLGATYFHVLVSEDGMFNGMLQGGAPLCGSSWAGKTGASELPPMPGPGSEGLPSWDGWADQVKVDLTMMQAYAQAVYQATDDYLASLTDDDLNHPLDLSAVGLGEQTVGSLLSIMLANANWHTGEIACLKGLQGLKGYPF